jgi:hypothetical protein
MDILFPVKALPSPSRIASSGVRLCDRHCERSEAIQSFGFAGSGLLRRFAPRNDDTTTTDFYSPKFRVRPNDFIISVLLEIPLTATNPSETIPA